MEPSPTDDKRGDAMTTADKEREELIQSIESELPTHPSAGNDGWGVMASYGEVADFILAREANLREENAKLMKMVEDALYLMTCFNMDCGRYKQREDWLASARAIIGKPTATERTL